MLKHFFTSIWPIDRTLSGATTTGQSGLGIDGDEWGTLHSPKLLHYWSHTIRLLSVKSRTVVGGMQRSNRCILKTHPTRQWNCKEVASISINICYKSSSSSYHAINTNIPDSLSPPFHIIDCLRQVLRATSYIDTELLYVGLSWLS